MPVALPQHGMTYLSLKLQSLQICKCMILQLVAPSALILACIIQGILNYHSDVAVS